MKAIVYYNEIPAGELIKNPGGYVFRYFQDYLICSDNPAISLSFPKQTEPFTSEYLFPFFFGLLSEGENKDIVCSRLKIDKNDYFQLLIQTAAVETIGAITVRAAG